MITDSEYIAHELKEALVELENPPRLEEARTRIKSALDKLAEQDESRCTCGANGSEVHDVCCPAR